ncbi:MAG: adenine deaminase [Candidatus Bipolaricaulota bacterium]|nr:adenine deaminase [Candidatus Bipolaricaulota bacterium]MDW8126580.1 adenine deaminase [Candidatus Bipolaricaulota bacterium]
MSAELLLRQAKILDVFSGQFFWGDLAVSSGKILGFGAEEAERVVDLDGAFLIPGLIDAHVHIESSKLSPREFAQAVLPHGTTAVIADPHEIANVLGLLGIHWMIEATRSLPLRVFFMAPSCIPASPLETPGAVLGPKEIQEVLGWERMIGLGEVMNFPGVIAGEPGILAKMEAARGKPIDGHAPGLLGAELWSYVRAGPKTDHECTTLIEAQEKLRAGMHILIREGTTARNLGALISVLTPCSAPFVHFCTDDREPETLVSEGHMDDLVRKAVGHGIPPAVAIASATIHTARAYGLPGLGALAPGYHADFLVVSDLKTFHVEEVYVAGKRVAERGKCTADLPPLASPPRSPMSVNLEKISFRIPAQEGLARVIRVIPNEVITEEVLLQPKVAGEEVVADLERDVLKIAVVERHRGTGNVGLGLVQGFGLKAGALASTVAHDSHHIVVIGVNDEDMRAAVAELARLGGGQVVVRNEKILASLPLPIAGLMSDRPLFEVHQLSQELRQAAHSLGSPLFDPFMTLSFLALPVIPALKITDLGLVDVRRFTIVPLFTG